MNKEQAVKFLEQVLANIPATRQQHEQFLQALKVLAQEPLKAVEDKN